jgi:phosphoribosylaminoimidazole carboxylase (NCAIR synthetase)
MINLLGNDFTKAVQNIEFNKHIIFHDYFKDEIRENRKMGHITLNYPTKNKLLTVLENTRKKLA